MKQLRETVKEQENQGIGAKVVVDMGNVAKK